MIVVRTEFEKSAPRLEEAPPPNLPEYCFAGRSNVGKSSLLNTLVRQRQMARVSNTPGRTQLLNFFKITIASKPQARHTADLRFCDLPGYGFAKAEKSIRSQWGGMIEKYLQERGDNLRAIIMLVDAYVGPQPKDHEMLEFLHSCGRPIIIIANKMDRLPRSKRGAAVDKISKELGIPRISILPFSTVENIGHKELWDTLCVQSGLSKKTTDLVLESRDHVIDDGSDEDTESAE